MLVVVLGSGWVGSGGEMVTVNVVMVVVTSVCSGSYDVGGDSG